MLGLQAWPFPEAAVGPVVAGSLALTAHHFAKGSNEAVLQTLAGQLGGLVIRQCILVALGGVLYIALSQNYLCT